MRRFHPLLIAGTALFAAACSDSIAPTRPSSELMLSDAGGLAARKEQDPKPSAGIPVQTHTFVIPVGQPFSVQVGEFRVDFAADAVCQAKDGYGKRFWDKPCDPVTTPTVVNAITWNERGNAYVDFSTDIRFDPTKVVTISTLRPDAVGTASAGQFQIHYWTVGLKGRVHVNEATGDKTLRTFVDPSTGRVYRRVKHFSGYSVSSGRCYDEYGNEVDMSYCEGGFQ